MSIIDDFEEERNTSSIITRPAIKTIKATGKESKTIITIGTFLSIFWKATHAESLIAEKIRASVDAVAVFELAVDVKKNDNIEANSKKYKVLVDPDDPGGQDECLVCYLKEIN